MLLISKMKIPIILFVLCLTTYIDCKESQNKVKVLAFGENFNRLPHTFYNVKSRKVREIEAPPYVLSASDSDLEAHEPGLMRKRCTTRLGSSLSPRLGATSKEASEGKNKKNSKLYEAFCQRCIYRNNCKSATDCSMCDTWCLYGNPPCDPKDVVDSKTAVLENTGDEKTNKLAKADAQLSNQIVGLPNRANFDEQEGVSHNVYTFNVEAGALRDKILNLFSIANTKPIESVMVIVKTLLNQPLDINNIGDKVKHNIETGVSQNTVPPKITPVDSKDIGSNHSEGKVLDAQELDRIVSEILAKLRAHNIHQSQDAPVVGSTNNEVPELRDFQSENVVHQGVMNPDIIEGPPDMAMILGQQEKMSEDMVEMPENLQLLNRNAELEANQELQNQLSADPDIPENQKNTEDANIEDVDTAHSGRSSILMEKMKDFNQNPRDRASDTFEKMRSNNMDGAIPSASYHKIEVPDPRTPFLLHQHHHHHHHSHALLPRTKNPGDIYGPPVARTPTAEKSEKSSNRDVTFHEHFIDSHFPDPHFHDSHFRDPHFLEHNFHNPNFIDSDFRGQHFHDHRDHFHPEFANGHFFNPEKFPHSHQFDGFDHRFFPRTSKSDSMDENKPIHEAASSGMENNLESKPEEQPVGAVHSIAEENPEDNPVGDIHSVVEETDLKDKQHNDETQIRTQNNQDNFFEDSKVSLANQLDSENLKSNIETPGETENKLMDLSVPRSNINADEAPEKIEENGLESAPDSSLPVDDHLEEDENLFSPTTRLGARTNELLRKIKEKQDETLQRIAEQRQNFERTRGGTQFENEENASKQDDSPIEQQADLESRPNIDDIQETFREAIGDNFDSAQSILDQLEQIANEEANEKRENDVLGSQPLDKSWENSRLGSNRPWSSHMVGSIQHDQPDQAIEDAVVGSSLDNNHIDTDTRGQFTNDLNAPSNSFGSLMPLSDDVELSIKDPANVYFIGNGIKLPLKMVKAPNGSIQFTVDLDKLCSCNNITCPKDPKDRSELEQTVGTILEQEAEQLDDLKDVSVGMPVPGVNSENYDVDKNHLYSESNKRETDFEDLPRNKRWFYHRNRRSVNSNTNEKSLNDLLNNQIHNLAHLFTENQPTASDNDGIPSFIKEFMKNGVKDLKNKLSDKTVVDTPQKEIVFISKSSNIRDEAQNIIPVNRIYKFQGLNNGIGSNVEKIEETVANVLENGSAHLKKITEKPFSTNEVGLVTNLIYFLKNLTSDN